MWFTLAFLFKPVGKFFVGLWDDAKEEMELTETENEKEN